MEVSECGSICMNLAGLKVDEEVVDALENVRDDTTDTKWLVCTLPSWSPSEEIMEVKQSFCHFKEIEAHSC